MSGTTAFSFAEKAFSYNRKTNILAKNLTLSTIADEELVDCYRNSHDAVYIGELYLRYTHLVYGVCLKYLKNEDDAKDATMQIFEQLIRELKRHRVTTFKPWLYTVVKNFCMMEFRKADSTKQRTQKMAKEMPKSVEITDSAHLAESEEERESLIQGLKNGLNFLKEEQRKCLQLFYLENLSYKAIEEKTGYKLSEIKSYIQNGKRNLKQMMTSGGND